ncbi:hypothetical protein EJB05_27988, partial [Eragrostis curvula]
FPASADIVDKAFAAASLYYNCTGSETYFQTEDEDDPHGLSGWRLHIESLKLKVLKNISSSLIALVKEKGAHHLASRSEIKDDPEWVIEQRWQEVQIIQGWIDQHHQDMAEMSS